MASFKPFQVAQFYPSIGKNSLLTYTSSNASSETLFLFNDIFNYVSLNMNWDYDTKYGKRKKYVNLFTKPKFGENIVYNENICLFINERCVKYLLDDLIFRLPNSNAKLPWLVNISNTLHHAGLTIVAPKQFKNVTLDEELQNIHHDCQRLGLRSDEDQKWYTETLQSLRNIMPSLNRLIELEIDFLQTRNINYRTLDLLSDYESNVSTALKLLLESSTRDRTNSPNLEKKLAHDIKKTRQRYFVLHLIYHIRNAKYGGAFSMNLSDIFYTKHSDVNYSFNLLSHLGVTQSLTTVRKRQERTADQRNLQEEIKSKEPCTWALLYDNFNKTHGTHSTLYDERQTESVELINKCALALPQPNHCPDERCKNSCIESCLWNKERPPSSIIFSEIYKNNAEIEAKKDFTTKRIKIAFQETTCIYESLQKVIAMTNTDIEDALIDHNIEPHDDQDNEISLEVNHGIFFESELKVFISDIKEMLKIRRELRLLYNINSSSNCNSHRIILPSVGGKDTDPYVSSEILRNGLNTLLNGKCVEDRLFIGGDQKTMGLAMRLKRQYPSEFNKIYVTIPDLHFRKSLMHAVLTKYENLGLKHLAKLCGYVNENQWNYLKNVCSIHKSFEFFERVSESLRISLTYEFFCSISSMSADLTFAQINLNRDNDNFHDIILLPLMQTFIQNNVTDEVFLKNIELLAEIENLVAHYTAERSRSWNLRTAALKDSLHFSMVSNCTQYGPLLIELLFHQLGFQERYINLLQEGHFTHNLRDSESSAFVGNDAVIEDVNLLAGQFRHKRQSLEQAITQSNSIDILQNQFKKFNENLGIKENHFEKSFKDDRETKIRIIRATLNYKSFQNSNRKLQNEFCITSNVMDYNPEVLKKHWYPTADFLIRRYIQQNPSLNICNINSANNPPTVVTSTTEEMMKRIRKSSSIVVNIKALANNKKGCSPTEVKIKRRAKQIMNDLLWNDSPFEDAAAICNVDGSKMTTNKSKFKQALRFCFNEKSISQISSIGEEEDDIIMNKTEWLSDYHISKILMIVQEKYEDQSYYSVMYPLPTAILYEIFNTNSRIFEKVLHVNHNCIIPLNVGAHWICLFFEGSSKMIYYLDSFGNSASDKIVSNLNLNFPGWNIKHNPVHLQHDTYQCGVWCCYFISLILDYLKNKKHGQDLISFLRIQHLTKNLHDTVLNNNAINGNAVFISTLRSFFIKQLQEKKETVNKIEEISPKKKNVDADLFYQNDFPKDIRFNIVSVDAQHTLWNNPGVQSGKDYVNFLGSRFFNRYFYSIGANTVYWNYDLLSVVKRNVPKSLEQEKRDKKSCEKIQFSEHRLLNDENIITDATIIEDWSQVTSDRTKRNQIAKYVGTHCEYYKLPPSKQLIVNSDAVKSGEKVIPQVYTNIDGTVLRNNVHDQSNAFGEGEGAAIANAIKNHPDENCLVVSNDSDAILYSLLAAVQRDRINGKFTAELWLEIVYTQKSTGVCGVRNKKVSEFWNINELVYAIERKLTMITNPVYSIVVLYLSAGSDFTEKWFGKTHEAFLKTFLKHVNFIGNLVDGNNVTNLVGNAYRKLIHCVWLGSSSDPAKVSFHQLRENTKKRKNVRLHLPDEHILVQHFKRVYGVFKYMMTYITGNGEKVDWEKHGYNFDEDTKKYYPSIFIKEIHDIIKTKKEPCTEANNHTNKPTTKINSTSVQSQAKHLNESFQLSDVLQGHELQRLIDVTYLSKSQIQK